MKHIPALRVLTLAVIGTLGALPALAQEPGFFYGGVSAGQTRAKIAEEDVIGRVLPGAAVTGVTSDKRDNGYKLFGGYQLNRNFGVEAGYFDLGKFSFDGTAGPNTVNGGGPISGEARINKAFNIDLVGTLPVTESLSVLGRVGVQRARTRASFSGAGTAGVANTTPTKTDTNYKVGVGLQYEVNRSFWVRGEVERYRINDAVGGKGNVNLYSVGLVFPFGRAPLPAPRAEMPAPAPYVAQAPAPAPVYVAPPPPPPPAPVVMAPVPKRVSFSAESLFGFDRAVVRPEGQAELDKFSRELAGTTFDKITVEGHTDRLGSTQYNQKLSMERAETVKNYLVTSGKLDGGKITAVGMGEGTPVTKPDDCKGTKQTPALIACLQPDRRVDVEVTGTK
jgi:OmpA-OmpF porin, OOP family